MNFSMTKFKHVFPTLLIPVVLLGAGCAQKTPVVDEQAQENIQEEVFVEALQDGTYVLAAEESTIVWNAQKRVGAKHNGTIAVQEESNIIVKEGEVVSGIMAADMTSIVDVDLTDEKFNTMLVNHLKSDDFFAVETYPSATFAITQVVELEGIEGSTHRVTGTMLIKGIENEISFPAQFTKAADGVRVKGTMTLDRTLWDVRFGSDKFFDNLGDGLIEDEFTLTFDMLFNVVE